MTCDAPEDQGDAPPEDRGEATEDQGDALTGTQGVALGLILSPLQGEKPTAKNPA